MYELTGKWKQDITRYNHEADQYSVIRQLGRYLISSTSQAASYGNNRCAAGRLIKLPNLQATTDRFQFLNP